MDIEWDKYIKTVDVNNGTAHILIAMKVFKFSYFHTYISNLFLF